MGLGAGGSLGALERLGTWELLEQGRGEWVISNPRTEGSGRG
jgi:hypothetical protein